MFCTVRDLVLHVLTIKPTTSVDALISQIYFWNKTLHVSDSSSAHHQQFFTVQTATVYVVQLASRIRTCNLILLASCQEICMTYEYIIAVCRVKNS